MNKFNFRVIKKSCATCKVMFSQQEDLENLCPNGRNTENYWETASFKHTVCDLYEPVELIFAEK